MANRARIRPLSRVHAEMYRQVMAHVERPAADLTLEGLLSRMDPQVVLPRVAVLEPPLAKGALKRGLTGMNPQVFLEVCLSSKPLPAKGTDLGIGAVHLSMGPQVRQMFVPLPAVRTLELLQHPITSNLDLFITFHTQYSITIGATIRTTTTH